jgi:23S rRNA-/tRNA-specific pseudouridylate synthase
MFAKDAAAARHLWAQFFERTVEKDYLAVVAPPPPQERFVVRGALVQVSHPRHAFFELRPEGTAGGRNSETAFERREARGPRCLLRALPRTGRTHQIRIHAAAAGSPILGDSLYAPGTETSATWAAPRLMLHARALTFAHPVRGGRIEVVDPLPADWSW